MKQFLKNSREGFTLVELMVVVAIIGILASIAIPQYAKFNAKSKQSEVRISLGAIYTVESAFQVENSSYTVCLGNIGFAREGSKFYYIVGFGSNLTATKKCGPIGANACGTYQWTAVPNSSPATYNDTSVCATGAGVDYFPANVYDATNSPTDTTKQTSLDAVVPIASSVTQSTFVINAAGNVLKNAIDRWSVDNNKQLVNTQSGLQANTK